MKTMIPAYWFWLCVVVVGVVGSEKMVASVPTIEQKNTSRWEGETLEVNRNSQIDFWVRLIAEYPTYGQAYIWLAMEYGNAYQWEKAWSMARLAETNSDRGEVELLSEWLRRYSPR